MSRQRPQVSPRFGVQLVRGNPLRQLQPRPAKRPRGGAPLDRAVPLIASRPARPTVSPIAAGSARCPTVRPIAARPARCPTVPPIAARPAVGCAALVPRRSARFAGVSFPPCPPRPAVACTVSPAPRARPPRIARTVPLIPWARAPLVAGTACITFRAPPWPRGTAIGLPGTLVLPGTPWPRGTATGGPGTLVLPGTPWPGGTASGRLAASGSHVRAPAEPRPIPGVRAARRPPWPGRPVLRPATIVPARVTRTPRAEPRGTVSGCPAARGAPRAIRPLAGPAAPFPARLTVTSAPRAWRPTRTPSACTAGTAAAPPLRRPGSSGGTAPGLAPRVPAGTTSRVILRARAGRLSRHVFLRHCCPALPPIRGRCHPSGGLSRPGRGREYKQ
jgi:hypothetical protein